MRQRHECVVSVRPPLADRGLHRLGQPVRGGVGEEDEDERMRAAAQQRHRQSEREPHEAEAADARQPDEDVVERSPPVLDDPALDVPVQRGASCFVRSTSCCRSNGFPMKPCAPRFAACCSASPFALPLNMTTGMAPTP